MHRFDPERRNFPMPQAWPKKKERKKRKKANLRNLSQRTFDNLIKSMDFFPQKKTHKHKMLHKTSGNFLIFFSFFFPLLGPNQRHMEVPRLGVKSQFQLPAYASATATPDLSLFCDLHCSSWQCGILNPLNGARYQTCILMDISRVHYCWATPGTPWSFLDAPSSSCTDFKVKELLKLLRKMMLFTSLSKNTAG